MSATPSTIATSILAPTEPGVVFGLPIEAYHRSAALSASGLRQFARSPLHYYAWHLDPERPPEPETTAAQLHGQLMHCATLEPTTFARRYGVGPDVNRNTKEWKAFAETCERGGLVPIKPEQREVAFAQARSLRQHQELARLFANGRGEASIFWHDPATGVLCRCRPDWSSTQGHGAVLVDAKSCSQAAPDEFARQIARQGYDLQAVHYSIGYELATGLEVLGFVFAAVEDSYPFAASAVMLDEQSLEAARKKHRRLLDHFAICQETNQWPGFENVALVSLPRWALAQED